MLRLFLTVGLAIVTSACHGASESLTPTSPSATSPSDRLAPPPNNSGPLAWVSLSGVVFEMAPTGRVPIDNVGVYCDACGHASTLTDSNGVYRFVDAVWVSPGTPIPLMVGKEGYQDPAGLPAPRGAHAPSGPGWREVTIDGDTQFDIELVRR